MTITKTNIKIKDLIEGYINDKETGRVSAYSGKLDIRPAYQREFVYKPDQQKKVICSILDGFPLNTIYWSKVADDRYEVLDGQQRLLSICEFSKGLLPIQRDGNSYHYINIISNPELSEAFLEYELDVYICDGTSDEKLSWFKTINIAGEKLTDQELRNAAYTGPWLSDAKKKFSATNCPATNIQCFEIGVNTTSLMSGSSIRQEILEDAISWIVDRKNRTADGGSSKMSIEDYMSLNQYNLSADSLYSYFDSVFTWVRTTFSTYRREMKGLPWGIYYNKYSSNIFDKTLLETRISQLMSDDDVTNKKGIYEYILSGDEKYLNIRAFTDSMKRSAYERQGGKCPHCVGTENEEKVWDISEMEADHVTPWHEGGKTSIENCQMLCKEHNRRKGGK